MSLLAHALSAAATIASPFTSRKNFNCRGCGVGGDVIQLVEHLDGVDYKTACETLAGPQPRANGKDRSGQTEFVVAEFQYHDKDWNTLLVVERIEFLKLGGDFVLKDGKHDKKFRQKRPDPDKPGKFISNAAGVPPVPYRLPQLLEAIADNRSVLIVEGEAKADLLWSWNIAATCCVGGAKKWKAEHSEFLRGADVYLLPDNDDAGWKHTHKVGAALVGIAKRTRVLVLPGLGDKGDIIDWANAGGAREQLDALLSEAQDWKAPSADAVHNEKDGAKAQEDALLDALAKAERLDYYRQRKAAAEKLQVPPALDVEVKARREMMTAAPLYGHWITPPWPEPVDGDSLLRDIIRRTRCHVIITEDGALAIALWIMLSWVHDEIAIHSPVLNINSAQPECGKSTTMSLIAFLMPKCIATVHTTEAALYRSIKRWQPSFAIDEFDDVLASDDATGLRSVINSGHTRGQGVLRCIGDDKTPELFPTFAPKAIGMVGRKLPPQTLSRCIFVELQRKKSTEKIEKFKERDDDGLAELRGRLRRWAMDNEDTLRDANPSMPDGLQNRRADNWHIQFAIADLCCGAEDWGDKARLAAIRLEGASDTRTVGAQLLTDARSIFYPKDDKDQPLKPLERISSADLVAQLVTYPDSPWAEWKSGKPITQAQLARLLKPFGIAPRLIRLPNDAVMRGYLKTQFEDPWQRYL